VLLSQVGGVGIPSVAYLDEVSTWERTLGNIPANLTLSGSLNASLSSQADLNLMALTPVFGGQALDIIFVRRIAKLLRRSHPWPPSRRAPCEPDRASFR
jgi:hypothetical protein